MAGKKKSREVDWTKINGMGNGIPRNKCGNQSCYCDGSCREDKTGDLTVTVTADVGEALTGFKALQRELRETTKAARELEQAYEDAEFRLSDWCGNKVCYCGDKCGNNAEDIVVEMDGKIISEITTEQLEEELAKRKREGLL